MNHLDPAHDLGIHRALRLVMQLMACALCLQVNGDLSTVNSSTRIRFPIRCAASRFECFVRAGR